MPGVEIIQGASDYPWQRSGSRTFRRALLFGLTLLVVAGLGLAWNYSRPAVYRATATVQTVKPKAVDTPSAAADVEHVAIQERTLLSEALLGNVAETLERLIRDEPFSVDSLLAMLSVVVVEQTNLVELRAEGGNPVAVQTAANTWAAAYDSLRQEQIARAKEETMAELQGEYDALRSSILDKQNELADFRARHGIASLDPGDNRAAAKLKGLNASLNKAREKLIEAEAQRQAITVAINRGGIVVPRDQRSTLIAKRIEMEKLRERLAGLRQRFTDAYIERDPLLRTLPGVLEELEREVSRMQAIGERQVMDEANQEVAAAQAVVNELRAQLDRHQREARDFATVFSQHEGLAGELADLRSLAAEKAERLAAIEARNYRTYPPVKVVEWATLPKRPIHPNYTRDAGLVLAIGLLTALFVTWLVEYLFGRPDQPNGSARGIRVFDSPAIGPVSVANTPAPELSYQSGAGLLEGSRWRVLDDSEVRRLLGAAEPTTKAYISLLLSGVAPDELATLVDDAIDWDQDTIRVGDGARRELKVCATAMRLLGACRESTGAGPGRIDREALDTLLTIAGIDAGFTESGGIRAGDLWYSYVVYLVRQGARLSELSGQVGPLEGELLRQLARYSPPGVNRRLAEVDIVYPLLREGLSGEHENESI